MSSSGANVNLLDNIDAGVETESKEGLACSGSGGECGGGDIESRLERAKGRTAGDDALQHEDLHTYDAAETESSAGSEQGLLAPPSGSAQTIPQCSCMRTRWDWQSSSTNDEDDTPYGISETASAFSLQPFTLRRYAASLVARHPISALSALLTCGSAITLFSLFPFPTTIPVFVAICVAIATWTLAQWLQLGKKALHYRQDKDSYDTVEKRRSLRRGWVIKRSIFTLGGSLFLFFIFVVKGVVPPSERLPVRNGILSSVHQKEKIYIAANLFNSQDVLENVWSDQLLKLVEYRQL